MEQSSTGWGDLTLSMLKSAAIGVLSFFVVFAVNALVGLAVTLAIVAGAWSDPVVASILGIVAFIAMILAAAVFGFKRAVSVTCAHALRTTGLASLAINFIFQGLVLDASLTHGERGHLVTKAGERIPLRQCEDALKSRVDALLAQPREKRGIRAWLLRATQTLLLKAIAKLTLAELRRDDSAHGGVDLHKVREKLIHEAQVTLPDNMDAKIRIATILGLTIPPALAALSALIAYWLLVRYLGV